MRPPFQFEPQYCLGLEIPDSYIVRDGSGIPLGTVNSRGMAQELVNLLNLTTQEQRDRALLMLYEAAA
jgi:hypothetical protein